MKIDESNRSDGHELCISHSQNGFNSIWAHNSLSSAQVPSGDFRIIDQAIRAIFSKLSILSGFQIGSLDPV